MTVRIQKYLNLPYNNDTYIRHVCVKLLRRIKMAWTTPAAQDMRFGFEITMYIANR